MGANPGIALLDEVGLGKTMEAIAGIGLLQTLHKVKRDWKPESGLDKLPACIRTAETFGGRAEGIPDAPHLIVVPTNLIDQWASELRRFMNPKAVDLIVVSTNAKKWQSDMRRLESSPQPRYRRVVLVTHKIVQRMFRLKSWRLWQTKSNLSRDSDINFRDTPFSAIRGDRFGGESGGMAQLLTNYVILEISLMPIAGLIEFGPAHPADNFGRSRKREPPEHGPRSPHFEKTNKANIGQRADIVVPAEHHETQDRIIPIEVLGNPDVLREYNATSIAGQPVLDEKVLVHTTFAKYHPFMIDALKIVGVNAVSINGAVPQAQRGYKGQKTACRGHPLGLGSAYLGRRFPRRAELTTSRSARV
ncbi:hypothetical protein DFJ43DRAFT_1190231 [Lentinula guzmanii]|uniref:SNF2 N-terminal domain-containing protein n=1 Tax=Lentinula guzmanii TaxID=2804957 RepID=A0AA38MYE9_9AGAR|nr:hypothetical protein DFJ43DRAFT_1190231 [Lentinula guzmanii]